MVFAIFPKWQLWSYFNQTKQKQDGTKQNTHRSLTTGQLFVLTELATSCCCDCHFPGGSHQFRWGQLRSFLCVSNKKPEKGIIYQILLSHLRAFGLLTSSQRPSVVIRRHEFGSFFYPHGMCTKLLRCIYSNNHSYTPVIPTKHNGKTNSGQVDSYSQPQKLHWFWLWSLGVLTIIDYDRMALLQKSAWLSETQS